ncbi:MAG: dinitrogenase iron-molybdenum cofactor biosynthesis protein [Desulfobacterales bacterium]|nr:dinitrogenase iron-molybdenum cofactor biosynthesis protein [Desulfobacterales bacterium]
MKIVISSSGPDLDSAVDPRFGRAAFFLIINSDSGELIESIDNSAGQDAEQGAGIKAAALVAEKGVQAILTGRLGPKAMAVAEKANIKVVNDCNGTVRNAIDKFRSQGAGGSGQVSTDQGRAPAVADESKRPGRGMGMGRGGGGRGRGKCGR